MSIFDSNVKFSKGADIPADWYNGPARLLLPMGVQSGDSTNTILDVSGNARNFSVVGAPLFAQAFQGGGFIRTGTSGALNTTSYLSAGDASWNRFTGPLTAIVAYRPAVASPASNECLIAKEGNSTVNKLFRLYRKNNGGILATVYNAGADATIDIDTNFGIDSWLVAALRFIPSTTLRVYVLDSTGTLAAAQDATSVPAVLNLSGGADISVTIGAAMSGVANIIANYFTGDIGQCNLYAGALGSTFVSPQTTDSLMEKLMKRIRMLYV
jgi:hypothetical protein